MEPTLNPLNSPASGPAEYPQITGARRHYGEPLWVVLELASPPTDDQISLLAAGAANKLHTDRQQEIEAMAQRIYERHCYTWGAKGRVDFFPALAFYHAEAFFADLDKRRAELAEQVL
jgi:hypothetical protein